MFVLALIAVVLGPSIVGLIWYLFALADKKRNPKIKKDFNAHYISTIGFRHKNKLF